MYTDDDDFNASKLLNDSLEDFVRDTEDKQNTEDKEDAEDEQNTEKVAAKKRTPRARSTSSKTRSTSSKTPSTSSKRTICIEWDDNNIAKLINAVEPHVCIWDTGVKDFHDHTKRDNAWRDISDVFLNTVPGDQLRLKWSSLRNNWRKAYINSHKTKSGQGVETQLQGKWTPHMNFLSAAEEKQNISSASNFTVSNRI